MLEAMRRARFSVWRVERRHETADLILRDLLRGEETWLVDETMENNPPLGVEIAGRLMRPEGFAMTARIVVPVNLDLLKEVFDRTPAVRRADRDLLAEDPRFAIGFIGSSGAGGAKLHRRDFGERVENLAAPSEYHWMAGNYLKYAGPLTATLPPATTAPGISSADRIRR